MLNSLEDISNDFLDRQTRAIFECDIQAYLDTVSMPYRRLSLSHDALLETVDHVQIGLNSYAESAATAGINLFYRKLEVVRNVGSRYIEGIYAAHQMRNANYVIPPYRGRFVLRKIGSSWKMIESERQLITRGWAADLNASVAEIEVPVAFAKEDIRSSDRDPLEEYQRHLDAIAKAEVNDDFSTYCSYLRFPYTAHSMQMDSVIQNTASARPFFDMIKKTRNGEVGDHLDRKVEKAEFLGANLMVGYHVGRAFKHGQEVIEPVLSRMILQIHKGRWQLLSVANTIRNKKYPFDMYAPGDELMTDIDIQKRTRKWPSFLKKRT